MAPLSVLIQHGEGGELPVCAKLSNTPTCPNFLLIKLRLEPLCCLGKEDGFELYLTVPCHSCHRDCGLGPSCCYFCSVSISIKLSLW